MDAKDLKLIEELLPQNEELRKLVEQHQAFEKELERFANKRYLTPTEELEKKRIQKLKLAGKDKIESILSSYRKRLSQGN